MSTLTIADPVLFAFADEIGPDGAVAVEGGRTRWTLGGEPDEGTRVVKAPTGIVSYEASEMIVQVRAGTTVAELDAELARHGQRCALPDRGGTVGGAVAVGENALEVLGRGRVRDAVLQVRYVGAAGELVTGGGPVVKNVTGYNLPKLMTGSLGTLGFLAEFVLRTNPVPAVSRWLRADGVDPTAALDAVLRPGAVLWDGAATWVLLEGHGPDIEASTAALAGVGSFAEVEGPPPLPAHRWSLTPAEAAAFDGRTEGSFVASIGVGTVWCDQPRPSRSFPAGVAALAGRMKHEFDPTGRCNPGRRPGA